ncbi:MAG: cytochrome c biogenesis protein CcsA [Actinomycetia bacterium]|nr:cytochrome c biogenesis protein CcsA [Actinomycetes bacterium]
MHSPTVARNTLWAVTAVVWLAVGRLAFAFLGIELQWRYVAEQSRRDAPWYYRLAGVWGGSEGSLLLFVAIVGLVACIALRSARCATVGWYATAMVGGLLAINVVFASPFGRLDAPAVRGFGLTPILEHPAMAIHPPLLYAGFGCAFAAALVALDGRDAMAWLRRTLAIVTLAMALGGLWSYVEQGWGGYWAWDPVENTSLLVWLGALIALHLPARPRMAMLAWVAVLAGAPLVRSGSVPSVHSFAEQASVGWALLALSIAAVIVLTRLARPIAFVRSRTDSARQRTNAALIGAAVFAIVALGTFAPVLIDVVRSRPAAVRGEFFSRTVGPLAFVAVPFLAWRLRLRRSRLVHLGALVLLIGIAASTFDRHETITLAAGEATEAAGLHVVNTGVDVEPGPRADVSQVVATLEVNGWTMRPALVAYPERGGVLAETAIVSRPWRDVQITLLDANDLGTVRVTVRQRPLMWLVWLGALLTAIGALSPHWSLRRRRAEPVSPPATR